MFLYKSIQENPPALVLAMISALGSFVCLSILNSPFGVEHVWLVLAISDPVLISPVFMMVSTMSEVINDS